ncbi:MAG: hypothetical protein FWG05_05790 [Kiritimatiellaeota bacterium]|nr:hypothetical protein [Kiritimatiellota bacterium]
MNKSLFFSFATLSVLLSGCAGTGVKRGESDLPQSASLAVQYAVSTGNNGYETAEVFILNPRATALVFTNAVLDGAEIWNASSAAAGDVARRFRFDIGGMPLRGPTIAENPKIVWRQFQPSPEIPAKGAGIFQICFRGRTARENSFALEFNASDGTRLAAIIPPYTRPRRAIQAVALSRDGSAATVKYSAGAAPTGIAVNGRSVAFRVLEPAIRNQPGVAVITLPRKLKTGDPLLVEMDFGNAGVRRAYLRALSGIVIEAPGGIDESKDLPSETNKRYGFDPKQTVMRMNFDVVCDDTRAQRPGAQSAAVTAERLKSFTTDSTRLYAVDFCTALFPEAWNIYTPIADAVIIKPYQLNWGRDTSRFIEHEDTRIASDITAAMPRPVLWVPERFGSIAGEQSQRINGDELEVLAWTALMRGARGIRHHWWKTGGEDKFAGFESVEEILPKLNADINKIRPILDKMVAISAPLDRAANVTLYECWSGSDGVLLMVRNMRYRRDPHLTVEPATDVSFTYNIPPWLRPHAATDALTGETLAFAASDKSATITIPLLDAFKLVWIPNGK